MTRESIKAYFERVAPEWNSWHEKNGYYHRKMSQLVQGMVPPGETILELGSGTGDNLEALKPLRGVGLNLAQGLTALARQKFPHLEFHTFEVDRVYLPHVFSTDYIIMTNLLDYAYDAWDLLESLHPWVNERTLLIITTNNPLWAPLLRLASRLRLRIPESQRNFITNRDIASVLELQGFAIVEQGMTLPVPKKIPFIGTALNAILPDVPLLRYTSSIQYLVARMRTPRPPLSCSVVIPCHNEAPNIAACIRRVPKLGASTEIVVIDDGSTDDTRERVREVMRTDPRVRLITFDQNQGKASAVRTGFNVAHGDVLIILDADMTVSPAELTKFIKPLQEGRADFVNGTRFIYPMQAKAMKTLNFMGNKAFCFLASWVIRQRVSDTLCGTKALLRRDYLRMLISDTDRWGDFALLFGAARLKLRILEIPVHYEERRAGKSKMRAIREGFRFLRACWHGWRMLRFPEAFPWQKTTTSSPGLCEIGPAIAKEAN